MERSHVRAIAIFREVNVLWGMCGLAGKGCCELGPAEEAQYDYH